MRILSRLGGIAIIIGIVAVAVLAVYLIVNVKRIKPVPVILCGILIAACTVTAIVQFVPFSMVEMPQAARISDIGLPGISEGYATEAVGETAQEVTEILKPLKYRREVLYTETLTEDEYIHFMLFDAQNENMQRSIGHYILFVDEPEKSIFQDGNVQYTVIASEETIQELMAVFESAADNN